jgi:putative tryptophan/tyrosine transport system substrate-binding protein
MKAVRIQWSGLRKSSLSIILSALHFAVCVSVEAQQAKKVPRIAYLSQLSASADSVRTEAFRQGLREMGYIEGQNIAVEWRYVEGKLDRLPEVVAELVQLKLDIIVVTGATATRAAKKSTETIPIVMAYATDPVELGLVASLAKPGANVTGLTNLAPDLGGKRLELLREIVPKLARVGVLADPTPQAYRRQIEEVETAAHGLGLHLIRAEIRGPHELENAFSAMTAARVGSFMALQQPIMSILQERMAELAIKNRLPAMYPNIEHVQAGGLMSYGPNFADLCRRAAVYVDKILKGTKPADLPVEQPTKFEFVISIKAAKQIGLTISPSVLARADKVIK